MTGLKLVSIVKSPNPEKKWRATFSSGKHTDFGAAGAEDYTQHHDPERRRRYLIRHKKDLETDDPTRAGYLSYYILWGKSKSIRQNIKDFKAHFHL